MAVGGNFRTAWNGFNRSDVVNYIEECAANYERSLRQLRSENAQLRADLDALRAQCEAREEAPAAEPPAPPAPPEPVPAPPAADELEAYRRAEAVERGARQRAARMEAQVNAIVASAVEKFDAAGADVEAQMSDLSLCLRRLNDTLAQLRLTFGSVTDAFSGIAPQDGGARPS